MIIFPAGILLHIPDGFLNLLVSLACWAVALAILALAISYTRREFDEKLIPLAGIMAAFIFAAQMINFPVAGGTSGHVIGAALAFIVLGPWLGMLVMTAVIALQALLFQDGGIVVMGANLLVMAVIPGFLAYYVYRLGRGRDRRTQLLFLGLGSWLSVMAAALVVSLLLAFSGTSSLNVVLPAMLGVHSLIGLGEVVVTVAALTFIWKVRPALLEETEEAGWGGWVVAGIAIAMFVVLLAPFASGHPDGLEWVAESTGFLGTAQNPTVTILPGYTVPGLGNSGVSTVAAGIIGVLLIAGLVVLIVRFLQRRSSDPESA